MPTDAVLAKRLASCDPDVLSAALTELAARAHQDLDLTMPDAEVLSAFDDLQDWIVFTYLDIVDCYSCFIPRPTWLDAIDQQVFAMLRSGSTAVVARVVTTVADHFNAASAVSQAVRTLGWRGASTPAEAATIIRFVQALLERPEHRSAVVSSLGAWLSCESKFPIAEPALQLLTPAERALAQRAATG